MRDSEYMKKKMKEILNEKRYEHSIRVAETAAKLAAHHGSDVKKAEIAGLLHDCARNMSSEKMIKLIKEDEDLTKEDYNFPEIIHGFAGAMYARNVFRVEDKEILNGIKFHTVGRKGMTDIEKIVYISDWIEPARTSDKIAIIRELAYLDLDKAILAAVRNELEHLLNHNKQIHINTIKMRNDILSKQ